MDNSAASNGCLGADTRRVVIFVVLLCLAGVIQFSSDMVTRHVVVVGGLQSKTSWNDVFGDGSLASFFSHREEDSDAAKTVAGVVEFDYVDYHLRQITFFFTVLFMQPLAARVASDEGNGRHQAVGQRLTAALSFTARASACALILVVGSQLVMRADMVRARMPSGLTLSGGERQDSFQSLKFCGSGGAKASLLCIWHHTALRFIALPLHIVAKCAAVPCFLGVHRIDLVLLLSIVQAVSKMFFTWFSVMQLQLRLTGAGAADLLSALLTLAVLVWLMSLESIRAKYKVKWEVKSILRCWPCRPKNEEEQKFYNDVKTMIPRAIVFVLIRIVSASLFDAGNPWSSWSLNTAFGALQQLEELPAVVGDSLSLVITVVGCRYLNHIYMIYNPHDFEELVNRFPWITAILTLLCAGMSVSMAPYALGSTLAKSTGIGTWFGMVCYITAQVLSSAALMFEGLLFANEEFATVARMTVISFLPTGACLLLVWLTTATTPVLWLALAIGSATRLWLARRHVRRTTLGQINDDRTDVDEFDALLNDDDSDDDDGPVDLEARGLTTTRGGSGGGGSGGGSGSGGGDRGGGGKSKKARRPSTRRTKKEKHTRYANYDEFEKQDDEFQEAFRDGDDSL